MLDLSVPGFCLSESDTHQADPIIACSVSAHLAVATSDMEAAPDRATEDDCWCCCGHVSPSPVFHISVARAERTELVLFAPTMAYGWSAPPYHPPRA